MSLPVARQFISANSQTMLSWCCRRFTVGINYKTILLERTRASTVQVRFKGHSQWQNRQGDIKNKGIRLAAANRILTMKIRAAIKGDKSTDPKVNKGLSDAFTYARSQGIRDDTVKKLINTFAKTPSEGGPLLCLESRGPDSLTCIIEARSEKPKHLRNQMQRLFNLYGVKFGSCLGEYEKKGLVHLTPPEEAAANREQEEGDAGKMAASIVQPNLSEYEDVAIDVEAEDVGLLIDDDGSFVVEFITDFKGTHSVRQGLEAKGYLVKRTDYTYIPRNMLEPSEDEKRVFDNFLEQLQDRLPEVRRVFTNISPHSEQQKEDLRESDTQSSASLSETQR